MKTRLDLIMEIRLNLDANEIEEFIIPKPEGGESEQEFIGRCMSDLKDEFPDQQQRLAVCYKSWNGE